LTEVPGCGPPKPRDTRPRFAFLVNVPTDRFWDIAYAGCLQTASEENVIVEFHAPNEATAQQQKQIVEALMSRGIDGLAISPLNPESLEPLLNQASEMFPVICQDSDLCSDPNDCDSKRVCYIGTDNVALGRKLGELLKSTRPDGGKVAIFVGKLDVQNAIERQQGVLDALEGSNFEILPTFTDGGQPAAAKGVASDVLAKHPDITACVGLWGYNAPQAVNALSGSPDRDVVVGADESVETMRAIRQGKQSGSIAQQPYEFGYQCVKMLARLHRNEPVEIPATKQIFVETYSITTDNVEQIEQEIQAKLELVAKLKPEYGR
jgi:ribose transport system substrate-binding protein